MPRRSKTPGVYLEKPRTRSDGSIYYLARVTDPITSKRSWVNLTELGLTTKAQRQRWAENASKRRQRTLAALSAGGRPTLDKVRAAADVYLADAQARVRPDTLRSYREAVEALVAWTEANGPRYVQELDGAALFRYRGHLGADPKKGPRTANSHMLRIKAALNWWRRAGMLPMLTGEGISDALKALKAPKPQPKPLRPEAIRTLLEAADDVDLRVILFYLLTGLRLSEGLRLKWEHVYPLEIHVPASGAKTGAARIVELDVCPFLPPILDGWREQRTDDLVLGGWTEHSLRGMRKRLGDAGAFTFQRLRQTCGTTLTNAGGIYAASSAYKSAMRLGHSVAVAERFYLGRARIHPDARTIEEALEIVDILTARGLTSARSDATESRS